MRRATRAGGADRTATRRRCAGRNMENRASAISTANCARLNKRYNELLAVDPQTARAAGGARAAARSPVAIPNEKADMRTQRSASRARSSPWKPGWPRISRALPSSQLEIAEARRATSAERQGVGGGDSTTRNASARASGRKSTARERQRRIPTAKSVACSRTAESRPMNQPDALDAVLPACGSGSSGRRREIDASTAVSAQNDVTLVRIRTHLVRDGGAVLLVLGAAVSSAAVAAALARSDARGDQPAMSEPTPLAERAPFFGGKAAVCSALGLLAAVRSVAILGVVQRGRVGALEAFRGKHRCRRHTLFPAPRDRSTATRGRRELEWPAALPGQLQGT